MEFGLSCTIQLANSSVAGRRPARRLVADLLASWIAPDRPKSIITLSSSLAGHRPAREPASELVHKLDSVKEFGHNCYIIEQ